MDDDASSANSVKNFWHHLKKLGSDNSDHVTEEIISMVNEGHEQGVFQATEAEMITNIFEFGDKEAKDIMTNRKNILAIEQDTRLEDAITQMLDAGKSRFPVYHENIDEIVGILHFRDAIVADRKEENAGKCVGSIEGLLREAMVIPETKNIADLFRMMQKTKTQMVIVVDEYGQTKGVLAMEDILEEIVGNIQDEYDEDEQYIEETGNKDEYLNTKTDQTIAACVYPYWHPGGEYIAYSTNNTRQSFHTVKDERVEVLDLESDIVVYHPADHRLLLCDSLQKKDRFETFPAFSPDGRTLYFCSAEAKKIPEEYKEIRYNLCSIDFDPSTGTFGSRIDTLVNAEALGKSVSFPRPSYDGKYIMFTLSDYGNFSIWHKEADLWLLDLTSGDLRKLSEVNSDDTESFHNWSSNSRWFVFSSRRGDGLYTRLYLASMDENGKISKPFLLPQQDSETYYDRSVYSYNVPDFVNAPILLDTKVFEKRITSKERIQVQVGD